MSCSCWDNRCY